MRNHPLAHKCHFAAPYAHFTAAKWAAKIPLLREIHPPLWKCSKLKKWAAKFPFCCQMISKLQNGYEMISKLQNGLQKMFLSFPWAAKMFFFFPLATRWSPSYEMICKNTLWSQGKLRKCQQSLTTMHLKRRSLSLRSHTWSLSFHFLPP